MNKIIVIIGLLVLFFPYLSYAEIPIKTNTEWIEYWADRYNVKSWDMISVAICESDLNQMAINPTDGNGGSFGLFQYQKNTWRLFSKDLGEELDIWSSYDQAKLTAYAFSKNRQKHWTCAKKLGIVS